MPGLWILGVAFAFGNAGAAEPANLQTALASFHSCLVALEKPSQEPVTSPCARKDASALIGASRETILSRLGHPTWCTVSLELRFIPWSEAACGATANWGYSFYHLPEGWRGGGPELMLQFGPGGAVKDASWFGTK